MLNDFEITESDSKNLKQIRECFPHLVVESVQTNHDGLTNDILIVNGELVFRFPKNETWARNLLANEIRVIELARHYLDVPQRFPLPLPQLKPLFPVKNNHSS